MARFIIILVVSAIAVGLLWPIVMRLRRGRVPGEVVIRRETTTYFVPVAACLVLSVLISAALWWLGR